MITETFYLSDESNLERACEITGLAPDEIEDVVGRFTKTSHRYGSLRGEVVIFIDGKVVIRHHFNKKKLWEGFCETFY
jgi:hypothetical protein